jgi:hypothetical protein
MEATLYINVTISPSAPIGHLAEFNMTVLANLGEGPETTATFAVPVGQVTANFEAGLGSLDWDLSCSGVGCTNWGVNNTEANSGSSSAQSGTIGDNQSSSISVTLDVTADGEIDFYYKVSAEYSSSGNYFYDGLEFYIDNTLKGQYQSITSGGSPWTNVSYDVTEGEHTFKWTYVKDGGGGSTDCDNTDCADAAWIDDIVFPPAYMESNGTPGDVNMDGIINILDVIVIINMILGVEDENALADLNGDGSINIQDIILVINLILTDDGLTRSGYIQDAQINMNSNKLTITANSTIAGIELHTLGDYIISEKNMPDGWQYYQNDHTIVMVDLEGKGINGSIELEFEGELKVEENILSDWNGNGISATVNMIPEKMALNTAYPNPFNPVTTISYTLSGMDHVALSVYNLTGQLIETLVDNRQDAGSYTLVWDAAQQPSGMYILRMETGNEMFHQKLMIIK